MNVETPHESASSARGMGAPSYEKESEVLADARAVVARSFPVRTYEPRDASAWDDAAGRFATLIQA